MSNCSELQEWGRKQLYLETKNVICKDESNELLIIQFDTSMNQRQLDFIEEKDRYELVAGAVGDFEVVVRVVETPDVDIDKKHEEYY